MRTEQKRFRRLHSGDAAVAAELRASVESEETLMIQRRLEAKQTKQLQLEKKRASE